MLNVGVLGAGAIAPPYYMALSAWPQLNFVACASKGMSSAEKLASQFGIRATTPERLISDDAIDVIVNLTPPQVHFETSLKILEAGKHLYSEKPLTTDFSQAQQLVDLAHERGLRIGCAPDTFMGSAHQEARAALDEGAIGRPVAGALFLGTFGCEGWHPHPEPYYKSDAGPLSDHAPYYLTQLVNLLGPVASVSGVSTSPAPVRKLGNRARLGDTLRSEVDTTAAAVLEMADGQLVTLAASWDLGPHRRVPIEIYGEHGTIESPDPNWSDGLVNVVTTAGTTERDHSGRCFFRPTMITFQGNPVAYYRLCGLADMADAITSGRPHRANGDLALHVLEVIQAIKASAIQRRSIEIQSRCERPMQVGDDIANAREIRPLGPELLDARTLF